MDLRKVTMDLQNGGNLIFFMFNSLFQDGRKLSQLYASFLIPVPPFLITYSDISVSISAVRLAGSLSQPPPPSFLNQASQAPRPSTQRSRQHSLKLLWPPRFSLAASCCLRVICFFSVVGFVFCPLIAYSDRERLLPRPSGLACRRLAPDDAEKTSTTD